MVPATNKQTPADAKEALKKAANVNFKGELKEVDFEGYKFNVNTDLIDDVEVLELIDRIESKNQIIAVVDFLDYLIGRDEYEKMKAHFVEKEGRFKMTKLMKVYEAIFEKFDPKG